MMGVSRAEYSEVQAIMKLNLAEDWQATLAGLAIVAAIGLGLVGPGPQTVTLTAAPGAAAEAFAPAAGGWKISAALDGEKLAVAGAPTVLSAGGVYEFVCRDGAPTLAAGAADGGQARLTLANECAGDVALTLKRENAIPWPLFGLLAR